MQLRHTFVALPLLLVPALSAAQSCPLPRFDRLSAVWPSAREFVQVRPANVLRMKVPAGMTDLVQGHDVLSLRYADGAKVTVTIDDGHTLRGLSSMKPGPFLSGVFQGANAQACEFLNGWTQVQRATYRSTFASGPIRLFAYGGPDDKFEFVVTHDEKPDLAIRGQITGLGIATVESILSTITTQ